MIDMRWGWVAALAVVSCSHASAPKDDGIGTSAAPLVSADDWPMYGRDPHHSFTNAASAINAGNVASLAPAWSFPTSDAVSASPAVVDGVVYVGAWDGFFYALDAKTGALRWKFQVDCQTSVAPVPPQCLAPGQPPPEREDTDGGIITSSALVSGGVVYFAGGKTVYALRASDGALLWKHVTCGRPEAPGCETDANDPTRVFASPVIFGGNLYLARSVDGVDGYRGGIDALRASDGHLVWTFDVDQGRNRGCGNVWSSGALDERARRIVYGTADCQNDAAPPYSETILALSTDDGRLAWAFRPRASDTCDYDFGATANVIELGSERFFGVGGKDGTYYLLHGDTGVPAWATNVVFGGNAGGFIGSTAFDGRRVYGGTGLGDFGVQCKPDDPRDQPIQDPSFHALDVRGGAVAWEAPNNYSFGATTVADGVVFNGFIGLSEDDPPALRAYDAKTGALLAELPQAGAVNSSATVTSRTIYFGTGNSFDGSGGGVQAYRLP
jgi:polyvinyl alcohol dehydrogenase (cytochrome)